MRRVVMGCAALAALGSATLAARTAEACGCFAPPDPSVPIVQAGERILFSRKDGIVTAHIQIQYAGAAEDFGWLLPLPSAPTLELGTEELFTQLIRTTQPQYLLGASFEDCTRPTGLRDAAVASPDARPASGPAVVESSIGPYDYAVLRADSSDEMLGWLAANRYFVPAGTGEAVVPYVREGSYFLALKLRSGEPVGALQPVVVRYASDLPMIPIILTQVAAQPDMGIQVWMLGAARAIPRNYFHTVLNDARIDWLTAGRNYNDLVVAATREAPGRHTFVTEYAGPSAPMVGLLDAPGRFGTRAELAALEDPLGFVQYVNQRGFVTSGPFGQRVYSSLLVALLSKWLPPPARLEVPPVQFYSQIGYFLGPYRDQNPEIFAGWPAGFDAEGAAAEIFERVAEPTLAAGKLFREHAYLTRLYTTLSPEQMNRDPVFSENATLPPVSNVHQGTITYHCGGELLSAATPATLVTEQGFVIRYPQGTGTPPSIPLAGSARIETLAEEGAAAVVTDNRAAIVAALATLEPIPQRDPPAASASGGGGCALGGRPSLPGALVLLLAILRAWRCGPSSRA
jgi:hypothetical protein